MAAGSSRPGAAIVIPPRRKHFFGLVHQLAGATAMTAGQVGASDQYQIMGDADFLQHATAAIWTPVATGGRVKAQFEVVPGELLFQQPHWLSALGTGQFPQVLAAPKRIPRGALYKMTCDDRQVVAAAASVRVLHIGERLYDDPFEPARCYATAEPFKTGIDYTAEGLGALAANAVVPQPLVIGNDADFEIRRLVILALGEATIDIVSGGGKNLGWFSRACHVSLLGATDPNGDPPSGALPFRLPTPVFLPAQASLQITVADLSGVANCVQVILLGRKLKPAGGLPLSPDIMAALAAEGGS